MAKTPKQPKDQTIKKKRPAGKSSAAVSKQTREVASDPKVDPAKNEIEKTKARDFYVVGIGASAGGLDAFEQFFRAMPTDSGMAFVLVPHLDPKHKSMLGDLLKRFTKMPIWEATNGITVKPDTLYIIPPNRDMSIMNGKLHLFEPVDIRGTRHAIDFFFRSLAQDVGDRAVGIVLSGTGSEGSLGLRAIKGEGGLAFVQDPKSAQYAGMPESAIATGIADYIFPPEKIAEHLLDYVKRSQKAPSTKEEKPVDFLQKIFSLIRAHAGIDFSLYKQNTIMRRIEKRKAIHQMENIQDYVTYLRSNPHEINLLVKEILIRVTNYFRDPDSFQVLKDEVFPQIILTKSDEDPVRIWVAGCSTGEEAYSLAIVIKEVMDQVKKIVPVQIFATDIDSNAIEQARTGFYTENITVDVSPERLSRYFVRHGNGYKVRAELREMVVFAVHNIIKDPPFMKLDLLSCRNVLIYMASELQRKVIPVLRYALKPDGVLFLGPSENIGDYTDLFSIVDKKWKVFRARRTEVMPAAAAMEFPRLYSGEKESKNEKPFQLVPKAELSLGALAEQVLLEHFSPPCVIVNEKGEILYFHGRTGQFLEPAAGKASFRIMDMAREGLKLELMSAFRKALGRKESVTVQGLQVRSNGSIATIDLELRYITKPVHLEGLILIVFRPAPPPKIETPSKTKTHEKEKLARHIVELEFELKSTKEHLQTTIEELETSNEELKSTNEELQSSNEELQSTNEELETSREELQSVNEELVTVNAELQEKIDELTHVNNDMNNFLASTQIATIFLDKNLNVKSFTPAVTDVINFIQTDIGRPIRDFSTKLEYPNLLTDTEEVIRTLATKEKTVMHESGRWYLMRIIPYRTSDDVIEGAVLTFIDITDQKKTQDETARFAQCIVQAMKQPLLLLDSHLRVVFANEFFYEKMKMTPAEVEKKRIYDLGDGQWDNLGLRKRFDQVLAENSQIQDYVFEMKVGDSEKRKMRLNAYSIQNGEEGETKTIFVSLEDLTAA